MKVLVVGSGAREHVLASTLRQSLRVDEVLVAPGNGGTVLGEGAPVRNVPVLESDLGGLVDLARREQVDFTVVGPEQPISAGVADAFEAAGLRVFAPLKRCARFAASKVFTKAFLARHAIPTPSFHVSSRYDDALAVARMMPTPMVVRASGLSAGQGASVVHSLREAEDALRRTMGERRPEAASEEVLIEPFLEGRELSLLMFIDDHAHVEMPVAWVYKRLHDGDSGPVTDGVGACSPAAWVDDATRAAITEKISGPIVAALQREQPGYRGVLRISIMVTEAGVWALDLGVSFGDPECQVVVPALESDLLEMLEATAAGRLREVAPRWSDDARCGVMVASRAYPGADAQPTPFPAIDGGAAQVFHGGTAVGLDGGLAARGGRLVTVVGRGIDAGAARQQAYDVLAQHDLTAFHYRRDIGAEAAAPGGKKR